MSNWYEIKKEKKEGVSKFLVMDYKREEWWNRKETEEETEETEEIKEIEENKE